MDNLPNYICEAHTPDWHVQRSRYVTGSALATLMGMNKYKSINVLKKEYTLERGSTNLEWKRPVWWGTHMEPANLGVLNFILNPVAFVTGQHGFYGREGIGATLDGVGARLIVPDFDNTCLGLERADTFSSAYRRLQSELSLLEERLQDHDTFVVELKNSDLPKSDWPKVPPEHYWCQVQAQLWATELDFGLLVAKVGAADMRIYTIDRDDVFLEEANEKAKKFLQEVNGTNE